MPLLVQQGAYTGCLSPPLVCSLALSLPLLPSAVAHKGSLMPLILLLIHFHGVQAAVGERRLGGWAAVGGALGGGAYAWLH